MPAMFPRLILRNGIQLAAISRNGCKVQPMAVAQFHTNTKDIAKTQELIDCWDACNKKYFGEHRDTVNHPMPGPIPEYPPPVTMGLLPRSWIDALYDRTGVAGPYFTLFGFVVYIHSKEILVIDHSYFELVAFWLAVYIIVKKGGASISNFLENSGRIIDDAKIYAPMRQSRKVFTSAVAKIDTEIAQEGRHAYNFDVQQENLDLQLEARYRERVAQVHNAVKRRLDYQVELVSTKKRLEQKHMVDWIVDSVVKGITPKQEKEAITSCISNLQALSKANPAV